MFLILLNHSLLLASGLINYGARLGPFFYLCLCPPTCQHLNWFITFLATQQPFGSSLQHHQITLPWILPIGRLIKVFQNFRLALMSLLMPTLNMELHISHIRVALVDAISSEGGVIPVSEVCEVLIKIYNILDNVVTKLVGNSAHILVHVFNSLPGSIMEFGHHCSYFFTASRTQFP